MKVGFYFEVPDTGDSQQHLIEVLKVMGLESSGKRLTALETLKEHVPGAHTYAATINGEDTTIWHPVSTPLAPKEGC